MRSDPSVSIRMGDIKTEESNVLNFARSPTFSKPPLHQNANSSKFQPKSLTSQTSPMNSKYPQDFTITPQLEFQPKFNIQSIFRNDLQKEGIKRV